MKIEANKIYFCKTIEDAVAFLKECDDQDIRWVGDIKASEEINFPHDTGVCYYPEYHSDGKIQLQYSSLEYAQENYTNREIITYNPMSEEEKMTIDDNWKKLMQLA